MFKVDMDAIREAAIEARLMANPANLASPAKRQARPLAALATLATSHAHGAAIDPVLADLLAAAMSACDHWCDSETAREAMRQQCSETPPHMRADLLTHFREAYGGPLADSVPQAAAGKQPRGP